MRRRVVSALLLAFLLLPRSAVRADAEGDFLRDLEEGSVVPLGLSVETHARQRYRGACATVRIVHEAGAVEPKVGLFIGALGLDGAVWELSVAADRSFLHAGRVTVVPADPGAGEAVPGTFSLRRGHIGASTEPDRIATTGRVEIRLRGTMLEGQAIGMEPELAAYFESEFDIACMVPAEANPGAGDLREPIYVLDPEMTSPLCAPYRRWLGTSRPLQEPWLD